MCSLSSAAVNFISAVSITKPLSSGDVDGSKVSESIRMEVESPSRQLKENPVNVSELPHIRSRRRSSQNKTSYQLAHPPPSTKNRHRLRLRPKTLLQLQRLSSASRPVPVIDVLPSILFAPRVARRIPQVFQGKQGLGLDDLVFVRSQVQDSTAAVLNAPTEPEDENTSNDREVVAVICQSSLAHDHGHHRTEIRFSQDSIWTATALRSGAYEFVSHVHGETQSIARWVPKRDATTESSMDIQKFKFSLIDTNSRRHPVIGNMSKQAIDIYDWYTMPSGHHDAVQSIDTESVGSASLDDSSRTRADDYDEPPKTIIETDDYLRTVIAVTGVWVAFCEGWSPNFRYHTKQVISNGISEVANRRRNNLSQPSSPTLEQHHYHHQPLTSIKEVRYRPGLLHTSSLSSVPSASSFNSPSSFGSPMMSPRRTVSSSVTGVGNFHGRVGSYFDNQMKLMEPGGNIDEGRGEAGSGPVTEKALEAKGETKHDITDAGKLPGQGIEMIPRGPHTRKGSGQDLFSETTLVEELNEKSGRVKRALSYLKRRRTARQTR
ncbi:MAG: hypothetical protein L6R41_006990 [Letrouitia leprolyta]|nr:MAG: hypothetical protein L6R41_006990 [Letrouitia leprolyta]